MSTNIQTSPLMRLLFIGMSVAILLAAMSFFASILSPILLALFLAIIFTPIFHWLIRKGIPNGLALLIMIVVTSVIGLALLAFLFATFRQLAESLSDYQGRLEEIRVAIQAWLSSQGVEASNIQFLDVFDTEQLVQWIAGFLAGLSGFLFTAIFVVVTIIFAMLDAANFQTRLKLGLGADNPVLARFHQITQSMVRYILMRTIVNLITGTAVAVMLLVMGIDYAVLWGVLTFFLSYVPYIGITLATIPSVLLALVQYGLGAAIVVIIGVAIINVTAENLVAPKIIGQGLSISPLVVFLAFFFWSWLLGPLGMFLAMPIMVVLLFMLEGFDETRWLALAMGGGPGQTTTPAPGPERSQAEDQADASTAADF